MDMTHMRIRTMNKQELLELLQILDETYSTLIVEATTSTDKYRKEHLGKIADGVKMGISRVTRMIEQCE
jgi:hypothetical protein